MGTGAGGDVTDPLRDVAAEEAVVEQLARARERIANLEVALQTNRDIAMAIGIIMARRGLGPDAAFAELRQVSQRRQVKMRELAAVVVETGELPR